MFCSVCYGIHFPTWHFVYHGTFHNSSSRFLLDLPDDWQPLQVGYQHEEGRRRDHHDVTGGGGGGGGGSGGFGSGESNPSPLDVHTAYVCFSSRNCQNLNMLDRPEHAQAEAARITSSRQSEPINDLPLFRENRIPDIEAVMSVCPVSAGAAAMLLAMSGGVDDAVAVYMENPDPATIMTVCCVSVDVARTLLAAYGSADEAIERHLENPDRSTVMTVCSVSADAASSLLVKFGSADEAIERHLENPDPATIMTVCSVSSAVASVLLATYGSADEAIERHLENPDRSTVMTACLVPADVASTLVATHGSAHEAIAFHSENPGYLDLVFAPHVPFAQRQRVFAYNLSVTDHFTRKLLHLALGPDGLPLSPPQHRAQIMRPLRLVKASWGFFLNLPGMRRRPGQQLPPHDCSYTVAEYSSVELLRCMFGCVGYVSRRLTAAAQESWGVLRWGCEKWVMDRVIRGRAGNVQVRWHRQRRACCSWLVVGVYVWAACLTPAAENSD
jgi:hypothetical protein